MPRHSVRLDRSREINQDLLKARATVSEQGADFMFLGGLEALDELPPPTSREQGVRQVAFGIAVSHAGCGLGALRCGDDVSVDLRQRWNAFFNSRLRRRLPRLLCPHRLGRVTVALALRPCDRYVLLLNPSLVFT